jgi:hypothetical protein
MDNLVGKRYTFNDGDYIEVVQIKSRSEDLHLVTYIVQQGPGIPRRLIMEQNEFMGTYGYLFSDDRPPEITGDENSIGTVIYNKYFDETNTDTDI